MKRSAAGLSRPTQEASSSHEAMSGERSGSCPAARLSAGHGQERPSPVLREVGDKRRRDKISQRVTAYQPHDDGPAAATDGRGSQAATMQKT